MTVRYRPVDGLLESVCDVCQKSALVGSQDDASDKGLLEANGWRWQERRDPLDTCPACLQAEATDSNPAP